VVARGEVKPGSAGNLVFLFSVENPGSHIAARAFDSEV
jgi:hypothetical protein